MSQQKQMGESTGCLVALIATVLMICITAIAIVYLMTR